MVGTGYVGLVTGAGLANTGNHVTCLDIDERKIAMLERGEIPIYEPGLKELVARNVAAGRLHFTTDKNAAYRAAQIIFICVGTPPNEDGSADVKHVLSAAGDIAKAIDEAGAGATPKMVVVKSTVPVGTSHKVRDTIAAKTKNKFYIANNPEFLKEGAAVGDFLKPDRVICGVDEDAAGDLLRELYEPFVRQGNPIFIMDIRSSEMVKYASNAMLACKISFINEIANLCEHYGADVKNVREGMCADHRIGKQFLYPGMGYGGSCFPKDTLAVMTMGKAAGYECQLNTAVHDVNQAQRDRFWQKVVKHFGGVANLKGKKLAFWGISFKPETDDIREAPSVTLMERALAAGAAVQAYDPAGMPNLNATMPQVKTFASAYDALDGCDALIVCTEWSEFRHPDLDELAKRLKQKTVFDGRNMYRRQTMQSAGFTYHCVGRPPVISK
jgi:UDPglucose 6-dehydrogenase